MPHLGSIRQQVQARIAELEAILEPLQAEHARLKSAAESFTDPESGPPPRAGRARPRPRAEVGSTRPPGPGPDRGGRRARQAVDLVTARPGVTAAVLARAMGINRNYLYRVLPKLVDRGILEKRGTGYHRTSPGH